MGDTIYFNYGGLHADTNMYPFEPFPGGSEPPEKRIAKS